MPPITDLDPVAQVLEGQFKRAWALFREGKYDEANSLCDELLLEPRLGRVHRAGLHIILAHSPNDFVWHAGEAVRLYEAMYTGTGQEPTESQRESKETLIKSAKAVQAKALADEKALAEAAPPTEKEEHEWIQQQMEALDELEAEAFTVQGDEEFVEAEEAEGADEEMLVVAAEGEVEMATAGDYSDDNEDMLAPMREESDVEDGEPAAVMETPSERKSISATDERAIAEGAVFGAGGATGLATPDVPRATTGNPGAAAPRRSSRHRQEGATEGT